MNDLVGRQFGVVNGSVNWNLGPAPVTAFLQPVGRIGAEGVIRHLKFHRG
jgi:hypothetical protein